MTPLQIALTTLATLMLCLALVAGVGGCGGQADVPPPPPAPAHIRVYALPTGSLLADGLATGGSYRSGDGAVSWDDPAGGHHRVEAEASSLQVVLEPEGDP
jgi:hypothetical protein